MKSHTGESWRALAAGAAVIAAVTTGCSSSDSGPTAAERAEASRSASASASASAQAEREAAEEAKQQKVFETCRSRTSVLIDALHEIDSRLNIGMNFTEYSDRVGDAQVAYDKVFRGKDLEYECLMKVAVSSEGSLNQYIKVYNVWNDCIGDYACDFNEGPANDKAQRGWRAAGRLLNAAERGLSGLRP